MSKIQEIFTKYYSQYHNEYKIPSYKRKAAWKIINCRTETMGGHVQKCPKCDYHSIQYNSCKHRVCPTCSGMRKEKWITKQLARVLDTPHYHVIFTIAHKLNDLWLLNSKKLTSLLFKTAKEALFGMLENEDFLGAQPGMIATLQTWGETLNLHPHLHCLVTGGGLTKEDKWKETKEGYLVPVKSLMKIFRAKFIDGLHNLVYDGEIEIPEDSTYSKIHERLRKLRKEKWNVFVCKKYAYGDGVIKYLGNYIKGGAISNSRVISYNEKTVKFYYGDNKDAGNKKVMSLETKEFIRRFLLHVPKPHLKVVRYYGLYASCKKEDLNKCRKLLGQNEIKEVEELDWQDYCIEKGKEELVVCPNCGDKLIIGERFERGEELLIRIKLMKTKRLA